MRSSILSEAVTSPACSAAGVPRPSAEMPTTRLMPCVLNAVQAGRLKSTYAASALLACGSGGTSQKTESAPANDLFTTSASPCDPFTISMRSRVCGGSRAGSRTIALTESV
jgi:hypothetical protein